MDDGGHPEPIACADENISGQHGKYGTRTVGGTRGAGEVLRIAVVRSYGRAVARARTQAPRSLRSDCGSPCRLGPMDTQATLRSAPTDGRLGTWPGSLLHREVQVLGSGESRVDA